MVIRVMALALTQEWLSPGLDDEHRLRVLTFQATAAVDVATVAQWAWGDLVVGGLPIVVSLVAVATLRDAAEAYMITVRVRTANAIESADPPPHPRPKPSQP